MNPELPPPEPRGSAQQGATQSENPIDALREAEERFRLAFEHAPIGIALVSPEGAFLRVNRSLCELTGYDEEELVTKTFQEITHPEDLDLDLEYVRQVLAGERRTYEMEKRYFHRDGHTVWILLNVSLVRDESGTPLYFISQILDISDRKQLEARLLFLADHDEMTGLRNRRRFHEELARGTAYARRYGHTAALLILDLDNFKDVNDNLGHHAGDALVIEVARRLDSRLRATDILARIGGDEFAVYLPQSTPQQAERVAGELVEQIASAPYEIEGREVRARASLGVALLDPQENVDHEELLIAADAAMYEAKKEGGNRYAVTTARRRTTEPGAER